MKRVAVFGANGQLGKTLFSLVKNNLKDYKFFSRQEADITNKESLEKIFNTHDFQYCINCAAYTNVEGAEKNSNDAFLINAEGTKHLAEICKDKQVKLIHISTDYVFDGNKKSPYKTDDATNPINQYGASKLQGENHIKSILDEYYIIRTSWLYSPFGKNFVKTIIAKISENAELNITTQEVGTPTSCIDLSKFILYIIEKDNIPFGLYHFTAQGSATWYNFALEIAKKYNPEYLSHISAVKSFKTLANRPKYSILNIEKTETVYKTLNSWKKSLKEVLKELKK